MTAAIAVAAPQAWRVRFEAQPKPDQAALVIVREPVHAAAVATPVGIEEVLGPGELPAMTFDLMCVPAGPAASDLEKRAEATAIAASPQRPPIRAGIRTVRVLWTETKAFIFAPPDQFTEAVDAVVRFTVAARLTFALEADVASIWPAIDRHTRLTHSITRRDIRLQRQVGAMSERASRNNASLVRLEASLEQLDPLLASASKRLFAELVLQATLHERLEALEAPIELGLDHYELVNSRLIDARGLATGHVLEAMIALLLLAEVVILIIQTMHVWAIKN